MYHEFWKISRCTRLSYSNTGKKNLPYQFSKVSKIIPNCNLHSSFKLSFLRIWRSYGNITTLSMSSITQIITLFQATILLTNPQSLIFHLQTPLFNYYQHTGVVICCPEANILKR